MKTATQLSWPKTVAAIFAAVTFGFIGYCVWLAGRPDETLRFEREVVSRIDRSTLAERLSDVPGWKNWFHVMSEVELVDEQGRPLPKEEQRAREGTRVLFHVDPKKGKHRQFEIAGRITRFVPNQLVEIELHDDSKGKLFRIFDQITWRVELAPVGEETRILGLETVRTASWRGRVFGNIAQRIVMNQVFYPDLLALAGTKPPSDPSEP